MSSRGSTDALRTGWRLVSRRPLVGVSRRLGRPWLRPWWVVIDITDRCTLRCPTCAKWRSVPSGIELTTREWQDVLTTLRGWLGRCHVSFTGGEPLLRQDLPALIGRASALGLSTNVMTNGHLLDAGAWRELTTAGLGSLSLSLNGLTPNSHDRSRGSEGSHQKVLRALDCGLATAGRPAIGLSVIATGDNLRELPELVRWAAKRGVGAVVFQPVLGAGVFQAHKPVAEAYRSAQATDGGLWPADAGAVGRAVEELIDLKRRGYPLANSETHLRAMDDYFRAPDRALAFPCPAGFDNLLVDPYGQLRLCNMNPALGDVRHVAPAALWHSAHARQQRREVKGCLLPCRLLACNFQPSLGDIAHRALRRLSGNGRRQRGEGEAADAEA